MEEVEVIAATLNNTIARYTKNVQSLEIEIANLTAEIIRLQSQLEAEKNAKAIPAKSEK